jgi:serine protease Do
MKRISKPMIGVLCALLGGAAVFGTLQLRLLARETNNVPARLNVQEAPLNREARGVTSYSPVIKRSAPSVVNIYATSTVRLRRMIHPFFDDPRFRDFFGENMPNLQDPREQRDPRRGNRSNEPALTRKQQSLGSGVIVSPEGYILTANHVVQGADLDGVKVSLANGGREYTAKVIGTDPQTDIAVLKIDAENLSPIAIADSDKIEVGDIVMAIGNPFGVGQTVTMGMVSATGRTSLGIIPGGYENFIQTDASINQGNSGGALIDAEGRLIGINTAIFSPSGGNAGIGFAVPINLARGVMERLIQSGKVTRGYLGVSLESEITSDLAEEFQLPDHRGAMVSGVEANTPAAKAGIQVYDVIRELNGKPIQDRDQLRLTVSQLAPGTKVTLKILRSEPGRKPAEKTVNATLGSLPAGRSPFQQGQEGESEERPDSTRDSLDGVEVSDLDGDTREQLGVPANVQGALVTSVDPQSNSAEAGLRRGDILLEINRRPVRDANEAVRLSESATGKRVVLRIWRGGASMVLTVDNAKP